MSSSKFQCKNPLCGLSRIIGALSTSGGIKCWGGSHSTYSGTLGYGDTDVRGDEPGEMGDDLPYINLGTGFTVMGLAHGSMAYDHCAYGRASGEFAVKC